ncbi:MAG: rod shape-determining protein [Calditrichaeota bacterium]|nr:MAG: rod shape-determining protein [Calditrichota bacterium]
MLSFFKRLFVDIGVDLGTANTVVYVGHKGYVVNEPSVIAYKKQNQIVAVGRDARDMLGKTHPGITVIRPLADGVIADFVAGEEMIKAFIRQAGIPRMLINRILIGVPTGVTSVEKRAVIESAQLAGARKVHLISEPMAAAIGVGVNVLGSHANMIVDIGGGTTDIAVINYGGLVVDNTIRVAGDELNEALVRYAKHELNLRIGESTAERIKMEYATLKDNEHTHFVIKGIDIQEGIPRQVEVSTAVFCDVFQDVLTSITNAIIQTLDKLPPDLAGDVIDRGIILTGGGALMEGLDGYIRNIINLPVSSPSNALFCVAEGTRKVLDNFEMYKNVLLT